MERARASPRSQIDATVSPAAASTLFIWPDGSLTRRISLGGPSLPPRSTDSGGAHSVGADVETKGVGCRLHVVDAEAPKAYPTVSSATTTFTIG